MKCPIQIGKNIIVSQELVSFCRQLGPRVAMIIDTKVYEIFGKKIEKAYKSQDLDVSVFTMPGDELYKTRTTKEMLEDQMQAKGLGRDTCIVALGGGVTLDVAGFIASTYCRGIPYISCPTTLLAMVDACLGGKTGVNTPFGKNLIGTFYDPEMIVIDILTLKTLPSKEVKNGLTEMIKHGVIADPSYFCFMENQVSKLQDYNSDKITEAIEGSCRIKKRIVQEDCKEKGKRRLLNFGHTVGHALELVSNYTLTHGEAVAIGIISESYLSVKKGFLDQQSFKRIENLVRLNQDTLLLPPDITPEKILEAMVMDKKSVQNTPRFVMLKGIGVPLDCDGEYCMELEPNLLEKSMEWMCDAMYSHQRA